MQSDPRFVDRYASLLRSDAEAFVVQRHASDVEGPKGWLDLGPGIVRFRRTDAAKAERARVRQAERASRVFLGGLPERADDDEVEAMSDDVLAELDALKGEPGARIAGWSARSRSRLVAKIASLDLFDLVNGEEPPVMVTLTLPGDWLAVAPDAPAAAAAFNRWAKAFERYWHVPLRCIWKREFQGRGAPHWHLWMVPPVRIAAHVTSKGRPVAEEYVGLDHFKGWLSRSWTRALGLRPPVWDPLSGSLPTCSHCDARHHPSKHADGHPCNCSEFCRSLSAGTGVDQAEGARARDPRRLAVYFLKESLAGAKSYQNEPPAEWGDEQSIGRFWGVRGLDEAVVSIPLGDAWGHELFRVMRKVRKARSADPATWPARSVPRGGYSVTGWYDRTTGRPVDADTAGAVQHGAGEVRYRPVRRRDRMRGSGGWVAVNDGAWFGTKLGRYATVLSGQAPSDATPTYTLPTGSPADRKAAGELQRLRAKYAPKETA